MTKMMRVCVASDSTNQPVWNRDSPALNRLSITAKVRKSKIELSGPKKTMKRRMNPMSQCDGRCVLSGSTWSLGIAIWLAS